MRRIGTFLEVLKGEKFYTVIGHSKRKLLNKDDVTLLML